MGAQKNVPKKQKVKWFTLTCLFVKRKFNETYKNFSINYPYNNKFEDDFQFLTLLSNKLPNTLAPS